MKKTGRSDTLLHVGIGTYLLCIFMKCINYNILMHYLHLPSFQLTDQLLFEKKRRKHRREFPLFIYKSPLFTNVYTFLSFSLLH